MKNSRSIHPLQSFEWGEFRRKTGVKVIREKNFQLTIHKIPYLPWSIGYLPKGPLPEKEMIGKLKEIGRREKCIFIQLEPNIIKDNEILGYEDTKGNEKKSPNILISQYPNLYPSFHPLFTKYTFILDLTKTEEELLKAMHPKTRYNIKVAQKHHVQIVEDNSDEAFETYLKLTKETTKRQNFYAHTEKYHRLMWETLRVHSSRFIVQGSSDKLSAHLFLANYKPSAINHQPITLVAWILFVYKDTLYYPYGASSSLYRETMASNLMMWEAIRFGKKLGLKKFDTWGALGPNPDKNDPWSGFHRFKEGYGGKLVEFAGSFDLVINPLAYQFYEIADRIRWLILKVDPFGKLRINADQSRSIKR